MKKFSALFSVILSLFVLTGCVNTPTEMVQVKDDRPFIMFIAAQPGDVVVLDGIDMGAASNYSAGKTSQQLYHWGEYEAGLYGYYKDPAELAALSEQLLSAIDDANGRVAPVPLAEKGYYVFPVNTVKTVLEGEDPVRLGNMFGADAILYVTINEWDAQYVVLSTTVT
ncbi:hypothetical protein CAPTEDRAFT_214153, partial [Capitella teleta]